MDSIEANNLYRLERQKIKRRQKMDEKRKKIADSVKVKLAKIKKENKVDELKEERRLKRRQMIDKTVGELSVFKKKVVEAHKVPKAKKIYEPSDRGYKEDYLLSRGYDKEDYIPCEIPLCGCPANDIHHVSPSMRGERSHNPDGTDLIGLCRHHHTTIHNHNSRYNREILLAVVRRILISKILVPNEQI